MSSYTARTEREGDYWVIDVESVGVTQARTLDKVEHMARDLVAIMTDVPYDGVQVDVQVELPAGADSALAQARALAQSAAEMQARAAEQMRKVVADLNGQGMTVREVATALQVSTARAGQLIAAAMPGGHARVSRSQSDRTRERKVVVRSKVARGRSDVVLGDGSVIRRSATSGRYVTRTSAPAEASTRKARVPPL